MSLKAVAVSGGGSGGGSTIGGAVTGGTPNSVLFVDPSGNLGQDNANFNYISTTHNLTLGGSGAASISPLRMTGTPFAGTGSNSYPLFYIDFGSVEPTTLATGGTGFAINGSSTFSGNFIQFFENGISKFFVQSNGAVTTAATLSASEGISAGTGDTAAGFSWGARAKALSTVDGIITFTNNAGTGFTSLNLGPTVAAPTNAALLTGNVLAGTSNTGGANLTIAAGQSTGNTAGGDIVFQSSLSGTSGTAQNALNTNFIIHATGAATLTAGLTATVGIFSGNVRVGDTALLGWLNTRTQMSSPSDGQLMLANNAGTTSMKFQTTPTTLNGTTAGTAVWSQAVQGTALQVFVVQFTGYENNTVTNQTITYTTAFAGTPVIVGNNSGLTISTTASVLTITAPNNATLFNGEVIVMGV